MEFASILLICGEAECPNKGIEKWALMRLDEHGCYPWVVCGPCGVDIVPNPHPPAEDEIV